MERLDRDILLVPKDRLAALPRRTVSLGNCSIDAATEADGGILSRLPRVQLFPFELESRTGHKVEPMQSRRDASLVVPEARFYFDAVQDMFFADFSGCVVRHLQDVEQLRAALLEQLTPLGKKVPAIVNYEGFTVSPGAWDAYVDMAREVAQAHYSSVSRYTGGAFLRAKLGRAFHQRGTAAHVFGSEHDARKFLCCARQDADA